MDWRYHPLKEKRTFTKYEAWIDLIQLASHKESVVGNRDIRRGQVPYSQTMLADRWRWTRKTVNRFLKECEKRGEIAFNSGPDGSLIILCNYDTYQGDDPTKSHPSTQQGRTFNNGNNDNKKKRDSEKKDQEPTGYPEALEDWEVQERLQQ